MSACGRTEDLRALRNPPFVPDPEFAPLSLERLEVIARWHGLKSAQKKRRAFESGRVKVIYLDDYKDSRVTDFLDGFGFRYFNGRILKSANPRTKHLLAVKPGLT